ncbi:MAG: DUF11 domain-containing protein [Pirellulales bacterium]|nr:DUF11 domain-containing protein [Pirellulales bacterium]
MSESRNEKHANEPEARQPGDVAARALTARYEAWPTWWRWSLLAVGTLVLCSCRAQPRQPQYQVPPSVESLPPSAFTGAPDTSEVCLGCANGHHSPGSDLPLPHVAMGEWAPSGLALPWPEQEYLFDGGDHGLEAVVNHEWEVKGLDLEDTIAHYDTLHCGTKVQPSNRVQIYAPRFGAVRSVVDLTQGEQIEALVGVETPDGPRRLDDLKIPTSSRQDAQPIAEVGRRRASGYVAPLRDGVASNTLSPEAFQDAYLPFENIEVLRTGVMKQTEKALLLEGRTAAIVWSSDQAVQVILDNQAATAVDKYLAAQVVYEAHEIPSCPRLRLIKVASEQWANPGEEIDFTLRYDNLGSEPIGNLTILDNLTTRLEYVKESAQSSRQAEFFTEPNQGGSDILRWELAEPLPPGEGGVLRFRCRVR